MNNLGHDNPRDGQAEEQAPVGARNEAADLSDADTAILAAARRRDRETAAGLLLSAHALRLGRTCMALLGSQPEAEEALRESLSDALDGLVDLPVDVSLGAWLTRIARRRCAERLEGPSRPRVDESAADAPARRARRLLAAVRPTEREALVLRYEAELTFAEVAEACGVDEAAARQRVSRGLARLGTLLREEER